MSQTDSNSGPPATAILNIGQAAGQSGVTAKMIRYYESTGLLQQAPRSAAGYRLYSQSQVKSLQFIRRARDLGFSLERIRQLLGLWSDGSRKSADVKALANMYIAELDDDISKLASIRNQLQDLADCCNGDSRPDCPILDDLAAQPQR